MFSDFFCEFGIENSFKNKFGEFFLCRIQITAGRRGAAFGFRGYSVQCLNP
jgi:hypothetical protein